MGVTRLSAHGLARYALAGGHGGGKQDTGGVEGLEDPLQVTLPSNLFDEYGCKTLGPQLLVYTEEINFARVEHTEERCQRR